MALMNRFRGMRNRARGMGGSLSTRFFGTTPSALSGMTTPMQSRSGTSSPPQFYSPLQTPLRSNSSSRVSSLPMSRASNGTRYPLVSIRNAATRAGLNLNRASVGSSTSAANSIESQQYRLRSLLMNGGMSWNAATKMAQNATNKKVKGLLAKDIFMAGMRVKGKRARNAAMRTGTAMGARTTRAAQQMMNSTVRAGQGMRNRVMATGRGMRDDAMLARNAMRRTGQGMGRGVMRAGRGVRNAGVAARQGVRNQVDFMGMQKLMKLKQQRQQIVARISMQRNINYTPLSPGMERKMKAATQKTFNEFLRITAKIDNISRKLGIPINQSNLPMSLQTYFPGGKPGVIFTRKPRA